MLDVFHDTHFQICTSHFPTEFYFVQDIMDDSRMSNDIHSMMMPSYEQQQQQSPTAGHSVASTNCASSPSPMAPTNGRASSKKKSHSQARPVHQTRRAIIFNQNDTSSQLSSSSLSPSLVTLESPQPATMDRGLDVVRTAAATDISHNTVAAGFRTPPSQQRRIRTVSLGGAGITPHQPPYDRSLSATLSPRFYAPSHNHRIQKHRRSSTNNKQVSLTEASAKAQTKAALRVNDAMVYLDGPQIYSCQQCRTHLTTHDDIISKSFQGRRGRAYLLDSAVNTTLGPPEDRMLMTGLHTVCDLHCQRCQTVVGWTYQRAYEASQKYKEGKFIIETINLFMEESEYFDAPWPAGERRDRWRSRSLSWGSEPPKHSGRYGREDYNYDNMATRSSRRMIHSESMVYEYMPHEDAAEQQPSLPLT